MKNLLLVLYLTLALLNGLVAQEMVRDGGFESESEWIVYDMGSNDLSTVEFGYAEKVPTYGANGCLRIFGGPSDYTNVLVWQELELIGGVTYVLSAAFLDLTGDNLPEPEGFWCQIYISDEEPIEATDWKPIAGSNSEIFLGFNSWSGCSGSGIDGTFQSDACDGKNDTLFVAPGAEGQPVSVFIGIKTGVWGSQLSYDVAIDNLSLMGPNASAVTATTEKINNFALEQNYPNPFNAGTWLSYFVPENLTATPVFLGIYDLRGRLVRTLVDQVQSSGYHHVHWDGTDDSGVMLVSGMYIAKMSAGAFETTIKLTSLK